MSSKLLLHGHDTVQCAYYLRPRDSRNMGLSFDHLTLEKESLRQSKAREPKLITLGTMEFLLHSYGTKSGYSFVITNRDFRVEFAEYMDPSFYVTFTSEGLWRQGAFSLHERFSRWAESLGFVPYRQESLSRVDFSFDYALEHVDFTEDDFVSLSNKDSQHRENGQVQTFTYGKSDVVLRIYDKVAEIKQQSDKTWFYAMWGQEEHVWRIEWQVRKQALKRFGIATFSDLHALQGDLLRYLAHEHDTLRRPNGDSNRSRWPLHPLWADLQQQIGELNHLGVHRIVDEEALLKARILRIAISVYGYLKQTAAIRCLQEGKETISHIEAMSDLGDIMKGLHDPLTWGKDVEKRIRELRLGYGK